MNERREASKGNVQLSWTLGETVEGWQVTDEASERVLLRGMKREGDEVPFSVWSTI